MANNAINTAAEVAANIENMNNAVKANTPKTEPPPEYTASKRHEIPALWKVLGKARPVFTVQINKSNEVRQAVFSGSCLPSMPMRSSFGSSSWSR